MSQYLVMAQNGQCAVERRVERLAQHLAGGARVWVLHVTEPTLDPPLIGDEVTLGEGKEVSRTVSHELLVPGGEVIGAGLATHGAAEETDTGDTASRD